LEHVLQQDIGILRMGTGVPNIVLVLQSETVKWNIIGDKSMVSIGNNDVICLGFVDVGSDAAKASKVGFVVGGSKTMASIGE